jgi:hypothetical protein
MCARQEQRDGHEDSLKSKHDLELVINPGKW